MPLVFLGLNPSLAKMPHIVLLMLQSEVKVSAVGMALQFFNLFVVHSRFCFFQME